MTTRTCIVPPELIEVLDNIYQNLDNHNKILGIYLDLQKVFDTVNHDILLYKLYNYGVRGRAYNSFKNYLTNRVQFTCVNNISSTVAHSFIHSYSFIANCQTAVVHKK